MNRAYLLIAVLGFNPAPVLADCSFSLAPSSVQAGGGALGHLDFSPGADEVSAVQFEIQADPRYLSLVWAPGSATEAAGKSVRWAPLGPGLTRIVISDMNTTGIGAGPLLELLIALSAAPGAEGAAISIANSVCSSPQGDEISGASTGAAVRLNGGQFVSGLASEGVVNAASLRSGAIVSGSAVSLLGTDLGSISSTVQVFFDEQPAKILYSAPAQVNVVVPDGLAAGPATVRVFRDGVLRGLAAVRIVEAAPGLFTADGSGAGEVLARHVDGTLVTASNPARGGEDVFLFVTGAARTANFRVEVSGIPADVLRSEPVASAEAGVSAVLMRIPASLPAGRAPISLSAAGATAQPNVFLLIVPL